MNQEEKRYLELTFRLQFLKQQKQELEEKLNNHAILVMAKALDDQAENRIIGMITIMKNWIQEIEDELLKLEGFVFQDFLMETYYQFHDALKVKAGE